MVRNRRGGRLAKRHYYYCAVQREAPAPPLPLWAKGKVKANPGSIQIAATGKFVLKFFDSVSGNARATWFETRPAGALTMRIYPSPRPEEGRRPVSKDEATGTRGEERSRRSRVRDREARKPARKGRVRDRGKLPWITR